MNTYQAFKPKTVFVGQNPFQLLIEEYEEMMEHEKNTDPKVLSRLDLKMINRHKRKNRLDYLIIRHYVSKPVSVILEYCQENNIELQRYIRDLNKEKTKELSVILDGLREESIQEKVLLELQNKFSYTRRQLYLKVRDYRIKTNRQLKVNLKIFT